MATKHKRDVRKHKVLRVPIPKCRDPFVNTPLISLGCDANGVERFWISSFNSATGCMGVVIDENGNYRLYKFHNPKHPGFYSAVQKDDDTLWLCGDLATVVRFSLSTGTYEAFNTGAPSAAVFKGMAFDPATQKIFVAAYVPPKTTAISFDIRAKKTVRVHEDFALEHYMQVSFPNGDGTYSVILVRPGVTLTRWDPRNETVETDRISTHMDTDFPKAGPSPLIYDDGGRAYFPHHGWYDPRTGAFDRSGPRPEEETTWFARRGNFTYGVKEEQVPVTVVVWDMTSGTVKNLVTIPDSGVFNLNLSRSGKLVGLNKYGEFIRHNLETGVLELSKRLPSLSIQRLDCLCRIDKERLLGTPFITQRFWEVNLKTGKGFDCGRAAPGGGQIAQTWKIGDKIYMAAYSGGELVEYDPSEHPHFPENPRVVASPPDCLRPFAADTDGRNIYYSCSAMYGTLGSTVTKYDTKTGTYIYRKNPLPDQRIHSLWYDKKNKSLLCASSFEAASRSCPPSTNICYFARLSAEDLCVLEKTPVPQGMRNPRWFGVSDRNPSILGPLGKDKWLCLVYGEFPVIESPWWVLCDLNVKPLQRPGPDCLWPEPAGCNGAVHYAGKTGLFVLHSKNKIELWDMRKRRQLETLYTAPGVSEVIVQDGSIYLVREKDILVLDDCLKAWGVKPG